MSMNPDHWTPPTLDWSTPPEYKHSLYDGDGYCLICHRTGRPGDIHILYLGTERCTPCFTQYTFSLLTTTITQLHTLHQRLAHLEHHLPTCSCHPPIP